MPRRTNLENKNLDLLGKKGKRYYKKNKKHRNNISISTYEYDIIKYTFTFADLFSAKNGKMKAARNGQ